MRKWWFNSMLFNEMLERRCGLGKSTRSLRCPFGNTSVGAYPFINDNKRGKNNILQKWYKSGSYNCNNVAPFLGVRDILSFIPDETFLVSDSNGNSYSVYFDIEKRVFEIDKDISFLSELKKGFPSYLNSRFKSNNCYYDRYTTYDTKYSWNNHMNSCIDSYLRSQISIDSYVSNGIDNYSASYFYNYICSGESVSNSDSVSSSKRADSKGSDLNRRERSNELDANKKYRHLWVHCENCYGLNYKKFFRSKMNVCEHCGYHLKMSSSDRIELSIDSGSWNPIDEDMSSIDPIAFHSKDEPYRDRISSYQRKTGLTDAVQTGIGRLKGIPTAIGVMDFNFLGGSMGSVVGEKITRLIEYAINRSLPLILVCASGGARMQEGSLSLMQMAKISSALYDYQFNKKLFYVTVLTSPTTGGVTASFGMLGDIIIAEPGAYVAFAGKRVIEQTLNKTIPDGSQAAEHLFHKGLLDPIVPRNLLKGVLSELFQLHGFFPRNQNSNRVLGSVICSEL